MIALAQRPDIEIRGVTYYYPLWSSDSDITLFLGDLQSLSSKLCLIFPYKTQKGGCAIAPFDLFTTLEDIAELANIKTIDKEWFQFLLGGNVRNIHLRLSGKYSHVDIVPLPVILGTQEIREVNGLKREEIFSIGMSILSKRMNQRGVLTKVLKETEDRT